MLFILDARQIITIHVIFRDIYYVYGITGRDEYFEATDFKGLLHTKQQILNIRCDGPSIDSLCNG